MISQWYHTTLGRYGIEDKHIILDYSKLLDPVIAKMTLTHEFSHAAMAESEFGQATHNIISVIDKMSHLCTEEKEKIGRSLFNSQNFVQEGFATLMQILTLSRDIGQSNSIKWAYENLPLDYLERFKKMEFSMKMSQKHKDYFTAKLSALAMETGIRKLVPSRTLLESEEKFSKYLSESSANPNLRLDKLLECIEAKPWLITKPLQEIAEASGIEFFEPSTKDEIAEFLTHLMSLTGNSRVFSPLEIGETPEGPALFHKVAENLVISNFNLSFTGGSEVIYELKDFVHYSDVIEVIMVNDLEQKLKDRLISGNLVANPEVTIAALTKTGEKFLTATSRLEADDLLKKEFLSATLWSKRGGYNLVTGVLRPVGITRCPDLIIYNNVEGLAEDIESLQDSEPGVKFKYIQLGATEDHPFNTLMIQIEGRTPSPLLVTTVYGNAGISKLLEKIRTNSATLHPEDHSHHINNLLSFWMGMPWGIDWVKTMTIGDVVYQRK